MVKPDDDHTCRPTIVAFLAARYDDLAMDADHIHYWSCKNSGVAGWHFCDCPAPKYLRADIAAKRKILALHDDDDGWNYCPICLNPDDSDLKALTPCEHLRLLAAPFASHPDYDPAWAAPV